MELRNISMPVLVLPMDHYGSLGVIRSLGRLGVQVYGVHRTQRPVASFSRYCRRVFKLDLDAASPDQSVDSLSNFAQKIGARPLLITTDDSSALFVAQNASGLKESFLFPHNRFQVVWSLYSKKDMYFLAKRLSIPTAETAFPKSRKDVLEICEKTAFPVMLKASDT